MNINKRFLYLSLSFFLISLGLMLLSFSSYKPAKAATTHYDQTWAMTKCWIMLVRPNPLVDPSEQTWLSLGPAEWTVTTDTPIPKPGGGTGTISTTETWTVTTSQDQNEGNVIAFGKSADKNGCNVTNTYSENGYGAITSFTTSGAYGYMRVFTRAPNYELRLGVGSSIPTGWTVSGDIIET